MAKAKKISINAFEKVVKENYENTITKEWHGIPVTITRTISFEDVASLVAEVATNCFLSDGTYIPEAMHALLDCGVVERYTNISLPSNLSHRYELVMKSGIMYFLMPEINSNQYNDIVVAIRDKMEYLCDSNTAEFNRAVEKMTEFMNDVQEKTTKMFGDISSDDIQNVLGVIGNDRDIERRVVEEYTKKNDHLKIVGDE